MADIAFLLLIFFMVSTVFVRYRGLSLRLPQAEVTEEIKTRRNITHIWVARDGKIAIDDLIVDLGSVGPMIHRKLVDNPRIIVSLKCDAKTPYGKVSQVTEELRRIRALNINFATERESTAR
jgi:biopolymer transport protein ExbD